jgi:hypothetical protein
MLLPEVHEPCSPHAVPEGPSCRQISSGIPDRFLRGMRYMSEHEGPQEFPDGPQERHEEFPEGPSGDS